MTHTTTLPTHPVTGLRALGILPSGRIVWPVLGGDETGSGDDGQGGTAGAGQQPAGGDGGNGQGPAQQQNQQPAGGQQGSGDGDDLANLSQADLADMVRKLRKENASSRTAAKQTAAEKARQELAQEIGRAIGLVKDDGDKADPNKLAEQLQSERRERYAEKAARRAKLDADALLDSREFAGKLRKLDPTSDDFQAGLDALVKEYADNPRYKTTSPGQAPGRSGGDFSGGPGHAPTFTREQIARMSSAEYAKNREAIMAQLGQRK